MKISYLQVFKSLIRPVTWQYSSPDIAHFISGKFCDLDFDMTCVYGVCVCVCVGGGGGGGWMDCTV